MNGRISKQLRREGTRTYKPAPTLAKDFVSNANLIKFDKQLYRERRERGQPGMPGAAVVVRPITNDKGEIREFLPVSGKYPPQSNRYGFRMSAREIERQGAARGRQVQQKQAARSQGRGE